MPLRSKSRSWDAAFVACAIFFATASGGFAISASAQQKTAPSQHQAAGIVIRIDAVHRTLDVSCDEIPDYMSAMEMSFKLRAAKAATTLKTGTKITFTITEQRNVLYADNIEVAAAAASEPEPMAAAGLGALHKALSPSVATKAVKVGQSVPDFTLTDQLGNAVRLSQFQGKVVALTFGYSRCPNPNYCYRLSNNLAHVQRQLHDRAGRDFVLLTIAIDPENDKGAALAQYAESFHADPSVWHFLSGPLSTVRDVSAMFGMDFWSNEGLLTHSMHTVIINREGKIDVNLEGNQFTSRQLADLVRNAIDKH